MNIEDIVEVIEEIESLEEADDGVSFELTALKNSAGRSRVQNRTDDSTGLGETAGEFVFSGTLTDGGKKITIRNALAQIVDDPTGIYVFVQKGAAPDKYLAFLNDYFDDDDSDGRKAMLKLRRQVAAGPWPDAPTGDVNDVAKMAYYLLGRALKSTKLPTEAGGSRKASADEFMFMQEVKGKYQFKHRNTRNYLVLDKRGNISIPTGRAFAGGYFDA